MLVRDRGWMQDVSSLDLLVPVCLKSGETIAGRFILGIRTRLVICFHAYVGSLVVHVGMSVYTG